VKRAIALVLVGSLLAPGCTSKTPRLSVTQIRELVWLEDHGYDRDGFDSPKSTVLAVCLDIFPLPGIGHFYLGEIGDGLKMMLLSWLVYPFILAPLDAAAKSSYRNDAAFLDYAHAQGWFDRPDRPTETPKPVDEQPASQPRPDADPRGNFCGNCGARVDGNFCKNCGTKR
jgi:hypothetical protein